MIYINKIDENSYHKLRVCSELILKEIENFDYKEIVVFTDEVKIINLNLDYIFNFNGIKINYIVLPIDYKIKNKNELFQDTIILEIILHYELYKLNFINKTSYEKQHESGNFIEVKTKTYEPIIEGVIA